MKSYQKFASAKFANVLLTVALTMALSNKMVFAWSPETREIGQKNAPIPLDSQPDVTGEGNSTYDRVLHYDAPLALSPHDHFLLEYPIKFDYIFWTTADYRYGYRVKEFGNLHKGLDIPAVEGTPVMASGEGRVVFAGYGLLYGAGNKKDPYGIAIKIKHRDNYEGQTIYTVYTHLEKTLVKVGDEVETGQVIGSVGLTGNTSGPHLHYEVRILTNEGQFNQNPELWLTPPLEHGVLAGRITNQSGYPLNGWKFILTSLESGRDWVISTYDPDVLIYHAHDPYYKENYVLSDLPAGSYQVSMWYNYKHYSSIIEINAGTVNYVNFEGTKGFVKGVPPDTLNTDFLN